MANMSANTPFSQSPPTSTPAILRAFFSVIAKTKIPVKARFWVPARSFVRGKDSLLVFEEADQWQKFLDEDLQQKT